MITLVGIKFSKPTRIVQRLDNVFNVSLSDILGSEELHPKHLLYHVPNYLKGVHKAEKHFQVRHLWGFISGKNDSLYSLPRSNFVATKPWSTPNSLTRSHLNGKGGDLRWVKKRRSQIDWRVTISDGSKSSVAESPYGSKLVSPMMMLMIGGNEILWNDENQILTFWCLL